MYFSDICGYVQPSTWRNSKFGEGNEDARPVVLDGGGSHFASEVMIGGELKLFGAMRLSPA